MSSTASSQPGSSGDVPRPEDDIRRYGRHGDIKPENILWFKNGDIEGVHYEEGALVIADFGLTDLHRRATRSDIPAKLCTGTPTYEPPEIQLGAPISRAYDIWSLGCTFLEFLTWLVCGWEVLAHFPEARNMPTLPNFVEDTFFHISPKDVRNPVICRGVTRWMAEMRELPRSSAFVEDFLDLISVHMLVVDQQARVNARGLNRKLRKLLRRATKEPSYLTEPRANRQQRQFPLIDDGYTAYSLTNGSMPVASKSAGTPLPKLNTKTVAGRRLRSLSPPVEPMFFKEIH